MTQLTVVIPAYNATRTIAAAVSSAIAAGAGRVLVIDDASSDDTIEVARTAGAEVVALETNAGASAARRHGLALATSEYVVFLDADDALLPDGVRASVGRLVEDPALSVVAGRVVGILPDGRRTSLARRFDEITAAALLERGHGPWPPGAAVVRRESAVSAADLDVPHISTRYAEDYELAIRLALVGGVEQHDLPALEYRMLQGKSSTASNGPLLDKERIRAHYVDQLGLEISVATTREVEAAGQRRRALEHLRRREWVEGARQLTRTVLSNPGPSLAAGSELVRRAVRPARPRVGRTFVWATGQDDNIGDSLLRRPYVRAVSGGRGANVWVRDASQDFEAGLGLSVDDTLVRSWWRWYAMATVGALRGRSTLAINAGEMRVSGRGAVKLAFLLPVMALTRARSGRSVWVGAGVPVAGSTALVAVYRAAARLSSLAVWRDADTTAFMGTGRTGLDWAFGEGTEPARWAAPETRGLLTVALRGDRPFPDAAWWSYVVGLADHLGLELTSVVQVRRDEEYALEAAARFGATAVTWPRVLDHAEQEQRLRDVYARSLVTVSDRLHVLVTAATEGSIPLAWVPSSNGKSRRHFDAVDLLFVGEGEGRPAHRLPVLTRGDVATMTMLLRDRMRLARVEVARLRSAVAPLAGVRGRGDAA